MVTTLDTVIGGTRGNFAIKAKNLRTGAAVSHNDNQRVESASTIKLLVLCCLLRHAQDGKLSLRDLVRVAPEDITPDGSGLLQHAHPHAPLELEHLALLMMSVSDNIAANTIIRHITKMAVNEYAGALGLRHTRLLMERFDFATKTEEGFELGVTTAGEMFNLLEKLVNGELLDAEHTAIALRMLGAVQGSTFARGIDIGPLEYFGGKTGWLYSESRSVMVINECVVTMAADGTMMIFAVYSTVPLDRDRPYSHDSTSRRSFVHVAEAVYDELSR